MLNTLDKINLYCELKLIQKTTDLINRTGGNLSLA
jgi:hypothetical protein